MIKRMEVKLIKKPAIAILTIFMVLSAVVLAANLTMSSQVRAVESTPSAVSEQNDASAEIEFVSNEVLIKIKKSVKDRIKEGDSRDVGITSLNKINGEIICTKTMT